MRSYVRFVFVVGAIFLATACTRREPLDLGINAERDFVRLQSEATQTESITTSLGVEGPEFTLPLRNSVIYENLVKRRGALQKRLMAEAFSPDLAGIDRQIAAWLSAQGYRRGAQVSTEDGIRVNYRRDDGRRVLCEIKSLPARKARAAGARSTVRLFWTLNAA